MQAIGYGNLAADTANLTALVDAGGPYDGAQLRLMTAPSAASRGTTLAEVVEASFTGYLAADIEWNAPSIEAGAAICTGSTGTFRPTDSAVSESVTGWYITAGGILKQVGVFSTPVPMGSPSDELILTPWITGSGDGGVVGV